jgi:hypothetical protein
MKKCPICNSKVRIIGSECYPEEGIEIECVDDNCKYALHVTCDVRFDGLKVAAKKCHNFVYDMIKEKEWIVIHYTGKLNIKLDRCGECCLWMTQQCPREKNAKCLIMKPTCNDITCEKFEKNGYHK